MRMPLLMMALLSAVVVVAKPPETLRVLTWNVWHKGHAGKFPGKACGNVRAILRDSGADVVFMVETYGSSAVVAKALGFHHHLISPNLCVYSRYPIVETYRLPGVSTFNCGGAMVDAGGQRIRLFAAWLHYLPDARFVPTDLSEEGILAWEKAGTRDDEIRAILKGLAPYLRESDSVPLLLAGDFNVHSHLDWTPEAARVFPDHGGKSVRWPVSALLEEAGFRDVYRVVHPDPLEYPGPTWRYGKDDKAFDRLDRIDYIYAHGPKLDPIAAESHCQPIDAPLRYKGKTYAFPSDHGFVTADFRLRWPTGAQ